MSTMMTLRHLDRSQGQHTASDANIRIDEITSPDLWLESPMRRAEWYRSWVLKQVRASPRDLYGSLTGNDILSSEEFDTRLEVLWTAVRKCLQEDESSSINGIAEALVNQEILLVDVKDQSAGLDSASSLIFAIIGWQTMLYNADSGSCRPTQLAIADDLHGMQSSARLVFKQNQSACKRPLYETLLGFGIMLPPPNFDVHEDVNDKRAFIDTTRIEPSSFNAHLLTSIGRIRMRWTDSIACHLELDRSANVLYLYAWPSFCVANLVNHTEKITRAQNPIHACAALDGFQGQWATPDEVDQTLREVLLSYRLLFGQNKKARKIFRRLEPFGNVPKDEIDPLLAQLCGRKQSPLLEGQFKERHTYDLIHDLPVLRSRLAVLQQHLTNQKPRAWRDLWHDKRDSAQWFTFWAVVIIGGLGIFLGFLQVVLQAVQLGLQGAS